MVSVPLPLSSTILSRGSDVRRHHACVAMAGVGVAVADSRAHWALPRDTPFADQGDRGGNCPLATVDWAMPLMMGPVKKEARECSGSLGGEAIAGDSDARMARAVVGCKFGGRP